MQGLMSIHEHVGSPYEFIIVDDGSQDNFLEQFKKNKDFENIENYTTILLQTNQGKGAALANGVRQATGDFILTLDADMATSPLELLQWETINKELSQQEIWIGSREHPQSNVKDSIKRKLIGLIFNRIIRLLTGLKINDTQCGFKLYPASAAKLLFASLQTKGWAHDVELLLRAKRQHILIKEMPITWRAVAGSKINILRDSIKMFVEVWKISKMRCSTNRSMMIKYM
jgi:Glycosyltransferases involved in cell wall biogenesis